MYVGCSLLKVHLALQVATPMWEFVFICLFDKYFMFIWVDELEHNLYILYCNMNAFFSFDLFMVYIPGCKQQLRTMKPEALKSLYRSPGNKKKQLVLCKNYVLQW